MSLDTRGLDPQRLLPQSLEDRLLGLLSRAGGITLLAGVVLLWLCLVSWSISDPSLTHATAEEPRNLLGPIGAIVADLMLQTLGFAAVFAVLVPLIWGIEMMRSERIANGRLKLGFFPLAVLAVAAALSSFPVLAIWPLHHGFGGLLGDGIFSLVSRAFAFINHDRAGLAAGVLLIAAAVAMSGKAVGFEPEEIVKAFMRFIRRTIARLTASRAEEQPYESKFASLAQKHAGSQHHDGWNRGAAAAPLPGSPSAYRDMREPSLSETPLPQATVAEPHPAHRDWQHGHAGSGTAPQTENLGAYVPNASYPVEAAKAAPSERYEPGFDDANAFARADQPALSPPPPADPYAARDESFDINTDTISVSIAKRFAPASAAQERPQPAAAASKRPRPEAPARAGGLLGNLPFAKTEPAWKRPSLNLLKRPASAKPGPEFSQTVMRGNARLLEDVLADFGVKGEVKDIKPGPVVTLYELEPARGTKSSRVINLADDIARSMSVGSIRAAVVPGRNAIGLELPNVRRESVLLREMLESEAYKASAAALPLALGKSIGGEPVVVDLARMPHLLVAGTTGSGKSVGVNAMVLSLLYRHAPEDCRLLMIDPKMLELSVYNGIPHLVTPVVTDPHKAVAALNWAVSEMEERYKRMAALSVRNIDVFNNRVRNAKKRGELLSRTVQTGFDKSGQAQFETQKITLETLPHIVVVVDEFADLMVVAGKEVEGAVQRLAQMARAAGIHLIMATQRPSVDVITGTIKANFPTRISFKVTSKIDSRTILNDQGAEQLLGQGDMLFSGGAGQVMRVHGAFVSDEEVEAIADALRQQGPPNYVEGVFDVAQRSEIASGTRESSDDDLYDRAVAIVLRDRKASTSYIQRRLSIGYNRAADLIERMEREGLISAANNVGKREILVAGSGSADAA